VIAFVLAPTPAGAEEAIEAEATAAEPGSPEPVENGRAMPVAMPQQARLLLPTCPTPPFVVADLVSMLRVELLGYGTELDPRLTPEAATQGVAIVTVDTPFCDSSDIRVRVVHSATDQSAAQRFDFADTAGTDLARILALAVAEFLGAVWADLNEGFVTSAASVEERPAAPAAAGPVVDGESVRREAVGEVMRELERRRRAALYAPPRLLLDVSLGMRIFPFDKGAIFGPRVGLSVRLSRSVPLRLVVDVGYGYGEGESARGEVVDHAVLGGLALLYEGGNGRVRGTVGPRVEVGWGQIAATTVTGPYDLGEVDGLLLAAFLHGGLRVVLGSRVDLLVEAVVGYVLVGLQTTSGGDRLAGIAGASLGLDLGIAVAL